MRQRRRGSNGASQERDGRPQAGSGKRRPAPLVSGRRKPPQSRRAGDNGEPPKRSDAARHPLVLMANFVILILVMGMIGAVALLVWGRDAYLAAGPLTEDVAVVIERGSSVPAIATGLEERGVIDNQYVFLAAAWWSGDKNRLQAGEYRIPARASMAEVMDRIVSGDILQHTLTIAEGLTSAQVVRRLQDNEVLSGTIDSIPPEGSLLPETYQFSRGMSRQSLLETMREAMARTVDEAWQSRDPELPLATPQELVTLASIVEKETGQADERGLVAGVFANRLEEGMRLQSDPTILYGLYGGDAWARPRTIYRSDLERPNPYNTYQIDALPPGPIANPGRAALLAAAQPEDTDALFFVADGTGGHAFAATYEEHQQNVARWREIERSRGSDPAVTTE